MELRRKRRVRLITLSDALPDFEGIQVGRKPIGGHYLMLTPTLLRGGEEGQITSQAIDGPIEVPAEHVLFVQVLRG